MADQLLKELGIEGVTLHLNTLGDAESRDAWRAGLIDYFSKVRGDLSEDIAGAAGKEPAAHSRQQRPARPRVCRGCAQD